MRKWGNFLEGKKSGVISLRYSHCFVFNRRKNCSLFQILLESRVPKFKVAHGYRKRNSVTWQNVIQGMFKIKQPMEPIYHLMEGSFRPTVC